MTKILKLMLIGCFIQFAAFAQNEGNTTLRINKETQAAQSITLPEKNDLVQDFIEDLIKRSGGKVKHSDGFIIGKGMGSKELEAGKDADVYFNLDKTKNDGKEVSVVTLAIRDQDEKFASDTLHQELYSSAGVWLNSFQMKLEVYKRDREIADLTAQLTALTKKISALKKDMDKDKANNMDAIKDNEKALSDLTAKLEAMQKN